MTGKTKDAPDWGSGAMETGTGGAGVSASHFTTDGCFGQEVIARLLQGDNPGLLDLEGLPEPWCGIAQEIAQVDGQDRQKAFASALAGLGSGAEEINRAVEEAVARLDAPQETPRKERQRQLGGWLPKSFVEAVERTASKECPDPELRKEIIWALHRPGEKPRPLLELRKLDMLAIFTDWLIEHGRFVRDETDGRYYLLWSERRLFSVRGEDFAIFLYELTSVPPSSRNFAHLLDHCLSLAASAPRRFVVRVSAWDSGEQVLRVSRFDGTVYVLDGESIQEEGNGENGVIFADSSLWAPYKPEFDGPAPLSWLTNELPNWAHDPDVYGLVFRAWILATFFCELCPVRALAVLVGERGSGKSALWRVLLRLLFGPLAQISGVPDRPDGFTAAAAAKHIYILDNLDQFTGWLRDKLARIASGANDEYRKLYSNNEVGSVRYRCWVGITSRRPDTLKRDDLADRLLPMPLKRIDDEKRRRETAMTADVVAARGAFWGAVLTALNQAVASIRQNKLQVRPRLRLADWETLGRVFARNEGREALWDRAVDQVLDDQSSFLLEDDLIVEGLARWMLNEVNHGKEFTARELQGALAEVLFDGAKPPRDWPRSAIGFGRRLASIRRDLCRVYDVHWGRGTETRHHNRSVYRFWPKGQKPEQFTLDGF